jgi:hypothetical protein
MTHQTYPPRSAEKAPSRSFWSRWWAMPFSADTWRRTVYIVLALPASLAFALLASLGRYRAVARWQSGLTCRYLSPCTGQPTARGTAGRVIAHTLLSLPLNLVSLLLTAYLWLLVPINIAYPLRPGTMDSYQRSWGGPTLAGAWAVHAAAGVAVLFLTPWVVQAATRLQARLTRSMLGVG